MTQDATTTPATDYLTLVQAAKITAGRPSNAAIWRWCVYGIKTRDGSRLRLQHIRMGGQIFTTKDWIFEFGRKLAEANLREDQPQPVPPPAPRPRQISPSRAAKLHAEAMERLARS